MTKQRDRFWNLLLIAAVISAAVSLLTTTFGLLHYLSFLLAVPLALAVQLGLFGLAWLIGFGENRIRPLMVVLYIVAMIFSVVFSYVFLQSELVEKVKPIEAQRRLFDDIRSQVTSFGNVINEGVNESEMLLTKIKLWLDTEEDWDGARVEVSADGSNWSLLQMTDPPYDWNDPADAWSGFTYNAWRPAMADLSTFVGGDVYVRFALDSDGSYQYAGFYVDDVVIGGY